MANSTGAKLKVKIIIGSTRPARFGDKAGNWINDLAKKQSGWDVELLDLRDWKMPFFNEDHSLGAQPGVYTDAVAEKWSKKIAEADAFIITAAEYNRGPTAVLKNALDYAYQEWNKKPVAFVGYGSVGGARSIEHLRLTSIELQMAPVRTALHIMAPWMLVDDKGGLKPGALDPYVDAVAAMLGQIDWWGRALKTARSQK